MTSAKPPATFGAWVRTRRRQLDLTQAELGKRAGCYEAAIRKIEADERKPSRQLAELLSRALEIPFDQYLRRPALPALEMTFDGAAGTVAYRWRADEPAFAMPVRVGAPSNWQIIRPTAAWQVMPLTLDPDQFRVAPTSTTSRWPFSMPQAVR